MTLAILLALSNGSVSMAEDKARTSSIGESQKMYYVNTKPQGSNNHEVHHEDCKKINLSKANLYMQLGRFSNCTDAVSKAIQTFTDADGCYFCSRKCHVR